MSPEFLASKSYRLGIIVVWSFLCICTPLGFKLPSDVSVSSFRFILAAANDLTSDEERRDLSLKTVSEDRNAEEPLWIPSLKADGKVERVEDYISKESKDYPDNWYLSIDGQEFTRDQVIWDFLSVAFSDSLWLENSPDTGSFLSRWFAPKAGIFDAGESTIAWVEENITPLGDLPRTRVLNKWISSEITVSLGWVPSGPPYIKTKSEYTKDQHLLSTVSKLVLSIREKTGINLRFIQPGSLEDSGSNFARIRLVVSPTTGLHNKYKRAVPFQAKNYRYALGLYTLFAGGVRFTPFARAQADGFFIPRPDNSISFAVCHVMPDLSQPMLTGIVTECLLRALGLPEMSEINPSSFLGHWNEAEDQISMTLYEDGKKALFERPYMSMGSLEQYSPATGKKEKVPSSLKEFVESQTITDYDALMLRMLYCKALTPGMDKLRAARVLVHDASCGINLISEAPILPAKVR